MQKIANILGTLSIISTHPFTVCILNFEQPSFRKLCILKGIYPHDPKKKHRKYGDRRVYYHAKDIKLLRREPILWAWRSQKTYRSSIVKHKGRHNWSKVKRMQLNIPQVSIDHLVRERYATFDAALRDLDDCVTFLFLFSSLPSGIIPQLTALRRLQCQKLCKEFLHYIACHGILSKAFISVKGIYYQCRFKNKFDVTWIVPHSFAHSIVNDVDYRVMSSFLDFYQTMFRFVVFKLYKDANMKYPPFGDIDYDLTNCSLTKLREKRFTMRRKINFSKTTSSKTATGNGSKTEGESAGANEEDLGTNVVRLDLSKILQKSDLNEEQNEAESAKDNVVDERYSRKSWDRSNLFCDFLFLLNREVPQMDLEFAILSMGGSVVLDQECVNKSDALITHQVIDRKIASSALIGTREYVQPQWIFDCLNVGAVIPTEHYQVGVQCPPHLSPFVVYNDQSHKPSQQFVLEHWQKISKQFGGFVPSKKLKKKKDDNVVEKNEVEKDEDVDVDLGEMQLDIADIMDMDDVDNDDGVDGGDGGNAEEEEELNGFVDDDDEDEEEEKEDKSKVLQKERLKIANRGRNKKDGDGKKQEHGLETDGIPANQEEWMKLNLARSIMAKRYRKTYDQIRRKKTKKSRHLKNLEAKRQRIEQNIKKK